jgi:hypothetical protein
MSLVTIETALAQPLGSLSDHTQITLRSLLMFFDAEIIENFSCNSPYVENILMLYIGYILSSLCDSQVFNVPPCLVDENKKHHTQGLCLCSGCKKQTTNLCS